MRIIGGNDYYDGAAAYGIDPGILFVRKPFDILSKDFKILGQWATPNVFLRNADDEETLSWRERYELERGKFGKLKISMTGPQVIFCGKLYSGLFVTISQMVNDREETVEHRFWQEEKFQAFLDEHQWKVESSHRYLQRDQKLLEGLFTVHEYTGEAFDKLVELKIVTAMAKDETLGEMLNYNRGKENTKSGWQANTDRLASWDFQKAIDPVTAFQEISQWVGGTLSAVNGPATVEITDDNIKLAKHGMDKTSFRRPKQVK